MAYVDATAADLKTVFPRFAAVDDTVVDYWLERARRQVDQTWTEGDYAMGQMLLACHLMTLQGLGTGAESEANLNGTADFKTIRSGALTLERFDRGSAGNADDLSLTSYGGQFASLRRQNVGGARVTATGAIPYDGLRYPHGEA